MRDLLGPGRLIPWFQPVVSTSTQAVNRFEALVRFERPDGSVLMPAQLLPCLEQAGELVRLFPAMLHASLAACRQWRDAGIPAGVAVNVTTCDLRDPGLPGLVGTSLTEHGLSAQSLTLELSEQELLRVGDSAADALAKLRFLGVRVAIDDFGAGHSSLARLADVAVSELKIDRSLVMSADVDPRRQIVLRAAVDLGHRLGLEVVAEGVEDDDVAGTVRAVGADAIQGYLYSRPLPLAQVLVRYAPLADDAPLAESTVPASSPLVAAQPAVRAALRRAADLVGTRTLTFAVSSFALFLLWAVLQPGGRAVSVWIGNLAFIPVTLGGISLAIRAGQRSRPRPKQAWYLLAAALMAYLAGELLQWFYESVLDRSALPGPADVGYLGFYPLAMAGVLRFGRPLRNRRVRRALTLDVLIISTGAAALIIQLVLRPSLSAGESLGAMLLASAYPVGDLLLLFAAVNVLMRGVEPCVRLPLYLLVASFTCFVVTDSVYVNTPGYDGTSVLNVGWIASICGIMLAAGAARATPEIGERYHWIDPVVVQSLTRLPYLAVASTVAVLAASEFTDASWSQAALWVMVLLTTMLLLARQYTATRTNHELVQAYDALTSCDELTGLSTRRHFLAEAERELALPLRTSGSNTGTALVLLDIDHFTAINERYGQQAGDQVLTAVSEACRNQLRQGDLLGRYGGDEIIALLPNSSVEAAESIAVRIDQHLRGLCIDTATGPVVARISHGVAFAPSGDGLAEALTRVGAALQTAKRAAGVVNDLAPEPAHQL